MYPNFEFKWKKDLTQTIDSIKINDDVLKIIFDFYKKYYDNIDS